MYYLTETRVAPLITIRRERVLPARGEVLVRAGEQVAPGDVVARCQMPGGTQIVDVSRALRVQRARAMKIMRVGVGDTVQAGEVLAGHGGLLGRLRSSCRSPVSGQVTAVRNGMVMIEAAPSPFELRAHIKGQVTSQMPGFGVVISATGALIQGVWGSGGEADGVLKVLVDDPRKPIRARSVDVSCHATIIVGGCGIEEKALEQAMEAQVRGVILGSASADLPLATLPFPVILTEAFGTYPMSQLIFSLLQAHAGREVMMNARTEVRWGARRPEVFIPLWTEDRSPPKEDSSLELRPGAQVRILRGPALGVIGTITERPVQVCKVETGARMPVAEVAVADADPLLIPIANLELIR